MIIDQAANKIAITAGNTTYVISLLDAEKLELDPEDILRIDYGNILGELLTFPVVLNRIGVLHAEGISNVSTIKLELEILEATLRTEIRKRSPEKKYTAEQLSDLIHQDDTYLTARVNLIEAERNQAILANLYWAAKDKSNKLDSISHKLSPKEFEQDLLQTTVNGILIKRYAGAI